MMKLIKLTIGACICLYAIGYFFAFSANRLCKGWSCDEVYCPNDYAVKLPDGSYLPCEKFDDYMNGNKSVVR